MITKAEIVKIMNKRMDRLQEWLKNDPEKLPLKTLKHELKKWNKEIFDAQKLSDENDSLFPKHDLSTAYTFMNIMTAIRSNYIIALIYIKKLEKELKQKSICNK